MTRTDTQRRGGSTSAGAISRCAAPTARWRASLGRSVHAQSLYMLMWPHAHLGGGTAGGGESLFMSDYGCVAVLEAGRAGHYGQQTIAAETRQGAFAGAGRHRMTGGCLKISSFPTRPRCWARSYAPGGLFAWGNRQDCCGRRKSIRRRCWCAVLHGRQPPRRLKRCQPCLAFVSSGEVVSPQHGETIREIASVRLKGFARACRNKHCVAQAARDKTAGHWWK
jgi:hypothetical protein